MEALKKIVSAVLGGFVGGSIVGLAESVLIAWTGGGDEYGVFRFAAISYGLIGADKEAKKARATPTPNPAS